MDKPAPSNAEKLAKLRAIIKSVDICMLTTAHPDGTLHSRPMSNNKHVEFDGDLWFFTYGSTHKAEDIQRIPHVNVSFADPRSHDYVSLSGEAELVRDRAKLEELWSPVLKAWFPDGLDTPDIALLKVNARTGEYWDGNGGFIAQALGMVSALVTGKEASYGENESVSL